ncbi:hypothetical protein JHK87_033595 [Glycine soja]|nr:hypothetical protein JHK87_033595 [Glycine soja]
MACSSSHTKNFDVFVSFRGLDTRNSFTDHLFAALQRKGIVAFRDNQNINKGELLEPELLQAIEGSHVFIVSSLMPCPAFRKHPLDFVLL